MDVDILLLVLLHPVIYIVNKILQFHNYNNKATT